ncbi:hypothetical protein RsS62_53090 [Rhizobium dioscoreae]|nr:hypothetical protein RsS62_53090 [Rhizobium dioscoreae]
MCDHVQRLNHIEVRDFGALKKLDHIHPLLTAFEAIEKRLIFAELRDEIRLCKALDLALFD